jgi:hypothetical protein
MKNNGKAATLAWRTTKKAATLAAAILDTNMEEAHMEVPEIWLLTVTERGPEVEGHQTRRTLEISRPGSRVLPPGPI